MGKLYAERDERLTEFIVDQPVYFVATAPLASGPGGGGHVNVSPKGCRGTFAVLGPRTVAYLALAGSGAATIAHIRQNGRITIICCSFGARPMIWRLYAPGRRVLHGYEDYRDLLRQFAP